MANEEQIIIGYYIRVICFLLYNSFSGLNSKEYGVNFFFKDLNLCLEILKRDLGHPSRILIFLHSLGKGDTM